MKLRSSNEKHNIAWWWGLITAIVSAAVAYISGGGTIG